MNTIRTMSGTTDKLSVDDATSIASSAGQWGVRTPNLYPADSEIKKDKGTWQLCQNIPATAGKVYSASLYIKGASEDVQLRLTGYAPGWKMVGNAYSEYIERGQSGTIKVQIKVTSDCNLTLRIISKADNFNVDFSMAMLNEGDYAPYTSATKPYTVDGLANRLEKLENKLGGVVKALLCVLLPVRGCAA